MAYSNSFLRMKASFALCDLAVYTVHYEIIGFINSAAFGPPSGVWKRLGGFCTLVVVYPLHWIWGIVKEQPVTAIYLSIEFIKQIKTFINSHFFPRTIREWNCLPSLP